MNLLKVLKEATTPLMVFVGRGETAAPNKSIVLKVYTAPSGYNLATNVASPRSITGDNGNLSEVAGVTESITLSALKGDDSVAEMVTADGETVYVDAALAFDIANQELTHPVTGKKIVLSYAEDEGESEMDESEDESSEEDTSEDDILDESTEGELNEDTSDESEDSTESEDMSGEEEMSEDLSEDMSEEDLSEDMSGEEEMSEEDTSEDIEGMSEEDMSEDESEDDLGEDDFSGSEDVMSDVEISALELIDPTKALRLVATSRDGNEFAVFCGDNHVGKLHANSAGEVATSLFANASTLFSAFKPAFQRAVASGELARLEPFGFTPVKYSVKVADIVNKRIDRAVALASEQASIEVAAEVDRLKQIVVLSAAGLLKGAFKGKMPFVTELASMLSAAGVANADKAVRTVLADKAESFVKTIFEQANELSGKSDEYLSGLGDSIKNAKFEDTPTPVNTGAVTTMYTGGETAQYSGVISHPATRTKSENKFSRIVQGLGRR